jgi:hypothetical protein
VRTAVERFDERLAVCAPAAVKVAALAGLPAGPALISGLFALRAEPMTGATAIETAALWERAKAWCEAESMIPVVSALDWAETLPSADWIAALDHVGSELGAAVNVSPVTAMNRVALAAQVNETLPISWQALDRGQWSLSHLKAFAAAVRTATPAAVTALEAVIVAAAIGQGWTPHQIGVETAKALIDVDPEGASDRAAKAREGDDVAFYSGQDETASIYASGPALPMRQMMDAIETLAAQLQRDGDDRPVGQRRITAMEMLILGRAHNRPAAQVGLLVDLPTYLGLSDRAVELTGYGPITAQTARTLFDDAAFRRMITDPLTGELLDLGTTRYRPSDPLLRFIKHHDGTCNFPGCSRPATVCDCDHITNYPTGATDRRNLHMLCRRHHNLKTRKAWTVTRNPDGTETWTSAFGLSHTKHRPAYLIEPIYPPSEDHLPDDPEEIHLASDPDPPGAEDPLPDEPTITLEEYFQFTDDLEQAAIIGANKHYDHFYRSSHAA